MRHAIVAAALLLAGCGSSTEISPGMWTSEVALSAGQNQLWSSKTQRCFDPKANGLDPVTDLLRVTPLGSCTSVESNYENERVSVLVHCTGRPGAMLGAMPEARVRLNGRFAAAMIDGDLDAELVHEPQGAKLKGTLSARRTGDC